MEKRKPIRIKVECFNCKEWFDTVMEFSLGGIARATAPKTYDDGYKASIFCRTCDLDYTLRASVMRECMQESVVGENTVFRDRRPRHGG